MTKEVNKNDLHRALALCRTSFISVGIFSLFVNLLMLTPAFYMLQVYDRVLPSGSYSTLMMLTLIMMLMFLTLGGLEWVRGQILVRIGTRLETLLEAILSQPGCRLPGDRRLNLRRKAEAEGIALNAQQEKQLLTLSNAH